ncbi:MAG: winged helix-turn-helix transcriptional regulator [Armatimonadota bacterium]
MHHGPGAVSGAGGAGFPWLIVGLIALATLIGLLIWLVARGKERPGQQCSAEREVEENLEGEILAMLHQAGGSLLQTEIAANLNVSTERVARALRDMVDSGRVHRTWEAGRYTYRVIHRHAEQQTT